jgi:hypothetical protein
LNAGRDAGREVKGERVEGEDEKVRKVGKGKEAVR